MNDLFKIIEYLQTSKTLVSPVLQLQQKKSGIVLLGLTVLLGMGAITVLAIALHTWLTGHIGELYSLLVIGSLLSIVTIIMALAGIQKLKNGSANTQSIPVDQIREIIALAEKLLDDKTDQAVQEHPISTLLVAGLAGYLFANHLKK